MFRNPIFWWGTCLACIVVHFTVCHVWVHSMPIEGRPADIHDNFTELWFDYVAKHWFLFALLGLYYLAVGGVLARPLGIPSLFRDRPGETDQEATALNSYSFWSAISATVLLAEIWIVLGILEKTEHPASHPWWAPHAPLLNPGNLKPMMLSLAAHGGPFLILLFFVAARQVPPLNGRRLHGWKLFYHLSKYALGIVLGMVFVASELLLVFVTEPFDGWMVLFGLHLAAPCLSPPWRSGWSKKRLGLAIFFGSCAMSYWLRYPVVLKPSTAVPMVFCFVVTCYCISTFRTRRELGVVVVLPLVGFAAAAASLWLPSIEPWIGSHLYIYRGDHDGSGVVYPSYWTMVGFLATATFAIRHYPKVVPAFCIKMLLTWVVLLYLIFLSIMPELQLAAAVLAVVWIGLANSTKYKYRFPNLADYYRTPVLPAKASYRSPALCDDFSALQAWREGLGGTARPKLVLVGVSGGAYRSTFWVSAVLDALCESMKPLACDGDFSRHIRLITGASGGMVSAAYHVARLARGERGGLTEFLRCGSAPKLKDKSPDMLLDHFQPVVQHLLQHDIPLMLSPTPYQTEDRGLILEQCWPMLNTTFPKLSAGESTGKLPSLLFSPMLIETGQRLLIGNLDLGHLPLPADSALEFFKLFPQALCDFRLNTAVRMSASFPYLSPAISLPTEPARRVVDGGYYDNYGVNLSMAWAMHHRDWIVQNTSGLAFIQIRAFDRAGPSTSPGALERSLQWLTSPLEGGLSSHTHMMQLRNDEQVEATRQSYSEKAPEFPFETFLFVNDASFAMNWFLAPEDIDTMVTNLKVGAASKIIQDLDAWW